MRIRLAENIRAFRKARGLTQEQLSEVLGVTAGAVHKWEAGLSQPELGVIVELADFFDTSVDVLLGYEMRDNRLGIAAARLNRYRTEKNREGLAEAEKALKKYPHAFSVVYSAAKLYLVFGMAEQNAALLRRARELLEAARLLIAQNEDPRISESTIYGEIAKTQLGLGEAERAIEILKQHNADGLYDDVIGLTLAADCNREDEALPYLSEALMTNVASLIRVAVGYLNVYFKKRDSAQARVLLKWTIGTLSGLEKGEAPCFLDKINAMFYVCLARTHLLDGDEAAARDAMERAKALAEAFDARPDYRIDALKFISGAREMGIYDDLGVTAMEGARKTVAAMESAELDQLWKEIQLCEGKR